MSLDSSWLKADVNDAVVEETLGLIGVETPPPMTLTLVAEVACRGRPSLSKKESANSDNSLAVRVSASCASWR